MELIKEITQLVEDFLPLINAEVIGEEKASALSKQIEKVQAGLNEPKMLGDVKRKIITSFEEWEERVYGVVEFVRPDNTITQFKIQSITAEEQKELRQKLNAAMPIMPTPRSRGDKVDPDDPHYKKDMAQHEEDVREVEATNVLWILEKGLVDVEIPGKDDKEKMEFMRKKVGGDAAKIALEIHEISNLTQETVRPFWKG